MLMEYRRHQQLHHQIHISNKELLMHPMSQLTWTNRSKENGNRIYFSRFLSFENCNLSLLKEADKVYPAIETDNDRTVTVSGLSEYVIEPDQGKEKTLYWN